jgi:tRNA (cmo5U34)-methyltransferase
MSDFDHSLWADPAFSREYLDHADHYIPDRHYLFHVLRSFYRAFVGRTDGAPSSICDLGCGDGILTHQLLPIAPSLRATLVDGSAEMLESAKRRLSGRGDVHFVQRGFDELIEDSSALGQFHFVVSSFAIHHVGRAERQALFAMVHRHLEKGGAFMNIETALPDQPGLTEWYYQLWQEWIARHGQLRGHGDKFRDVPTKARENPDNQYSPLGEQLADLSSAGFNEVECHYKNGIFAIYTGRKADESASKGD